MTDDNKKENLIIQSSSDLKRVGNSLEIISKIISENNFRKYHNWWNSLNKIWKTLFFWTMNGKETYQIITQGELAGDIISDIEIEDIRELSINEIQSILNITKIEFPWNTNFSDLSPLSEIKTLNNLWFEHCDVTDLTPLTNLTNLEVLNFQSNNVEDLTPIKNLINLKILLGSSNNIQDLDSLINLTNLEELSISGTYSSIEPLQNLKKLKKVSLHGVSYFGENGNLEDINTLKYLGNISHLDISSQLIDSLEPIWNLPNLKRLTLHVTKLNDSQIIEFEHCHPNCKVSNYGNGLF